MKKSFRFLAVSCLFLLTGCLEIFEGLTLQEGGSGRYVFQMNFRDEAGMLGRDKFLDSTFAIDSFVRRSAKLSEAERLLLLGATVHLRAAPADSQFRFSVSAPFVSAGQLRPLADAEGRGKALAALDDPDEATIPFGEILSDPGLPTLNKAFDLSSGAGCIERRLDRE